MKENTVASLVTACATSGLLVKGSAYTSLVAKTRTKKNKPIATEDSTTTSIENLAALGLPAPSSFEILTLIQIHAPH